LDCTLIDDRFPARQRELRDLFARLAPSDAQPLGQAGTLIHPWDGAVQVVPRRWDFAFEPRALDHVRFTVEFARAELPPAPSNAGVVAKTSDALNTILGVDGHLLAAEPDPLAQLEAVRPLLGIPDTITGADYTQAASERLATASNVTVTRTPLAIQEMGAAARAAALGQLTTKGRDRVIALVAQEAIRSNSLGLLQQSESFSLYLGTLGISAFGQVQVAPQSPLQLLATGTPLKRLAELNRDAVLNWRVFGSARI
jgi:hypothetical protein